MRSNVRSSVRSLPSRPMIFFMFVHCKSPQDTPITSVFIKALSCAKAQPDDTASLLIRPCSKSSPRQGKRLPERLPRTRRRVGPSRMRLKTSRGSSSAIRRAWSSLRPRSAAYSARRGPGTSLWRQGGAAAGACPPQGLIVTRPQQDRDCLRYPPRTLMPLPLMMLGALKLPWRNNSVPPILTQHMSTAVPLPLTHLVMALFLSLTRACLRFRSS